MPSSFKNQTITTTRRNKMKKALLALLSIAIAFTALAPAQAQDQKVLAIIDTAIDSSKFPSVIYEACFTENNSCPNKLNSMEGPGSANAVVWNKSITNTIYHGHNMTAGALAVNQNIKIVFVRVYNVTALGNSSTSSDGSSIRLALEWVNKNASKYSIDAVSISQSGINTKTKSLHSGCTNPLILNPFLNEVSQLTLKNIPVFAATGNDSLSNIVGFPACVEGVVGVGALAAFPRTPSVYENFAGVTNRGPGLDLVAPGDTAITRYDGAKSETSSTSGATVIAASAYVSRSNNSSFLEYVKTLAKVLNFPYISK